MEAFKKLIKNKRTLVFLDLEGTQFSHEIIAIGAVKCKIDENGNIIPLIKETVNNWVPKAMVQEVGTVLTVGDGIATVDGLKNATEDIRVEKSSAEFKEIDVFKSNSEATVILLGESGTLYELRRGWRGGIMVSVDGGKQQPCDIITEPYEVIYTYTK